MSFVAPSQVRSGYYSEKLSAERLELCYMLAPPRVQQYLSAEIEYILSVIAPGSTVLELGCGYGRVLEQLATVSHLVYGVDTSFESLCLAQRRLASKTNVIIAGMDASEPAFAAATFDVVCCVQNGISSFHVDQRALLEVAVKITNPGGLVLFSSYAEEFWEHRLEWFRLQSKHGLIGEIDESATTDGTIVCKDGFTATTVAPAQFADLAHGLGADVTIDVVDGSSVFCVITDR